MAFNLVIIIIKIQQNVILHNMIE